VGLGGSKIALVAGGRNSRGLAVVLVAVAFLLANCAAPSAQSPPPGQSPPPAGGTPEVGVAYRVTLSCSIPFALGATWWDFDKPHTWPPQKPGVMQQSPYPVPGVITLKSANEAVFRVDIDGSLLTLTRLAGTPDLGELCA
jgi:hypothetical protein